MGNDEFDTLRKHAIKAAKLVVIVTVIAAALCYLEMLFEKWGFPPEFVFLVKLLFYGSFIIDCILILGTLYVFTVRYFKKIIKEPEKKDAGEKDSKTEDR